MTSALAGNLSAFEAIIHRYQKVVSGMLRRLSNNSDTVDDLVQLTFVTAWQKLGTYAGGRLQSWLCSIAYRTFLQAKRSEKPEYNAEESRLADVHYENTDSNRSMDIDRALDIDRVLAELSLEQRTTIVLCLILGFTHSEASALTAWPLGTIKSHINRGKRRLRLLLIDYANEDNTHE